MVAWLRSSIASVALISYFTYKKYNFISTVIKIQNAFKIVLYYAQIIL